jgi:hypothetical protein
MAAPKKRETLSKALFKRPKLEAAEWDFRWVKNEAEASAVYRYELGREILREASYVLKNKHETFYKQIQSILADFGKSSLSHLFHPVINPRKSPQADTLNYLARISYGEAQIDGIPPPAYLVRKKIRSGLKSQKLILDEIIIKEIEASETPKDGTTVITLTFSRYESERPTKSKAKEIINNWLAKSNYFQRKKAGRDTNTLVKLAAYRYSQGEDKPLYSIDKGLNESKVIKEDYGKDLFEKYIISEERKHIPASSWSDDINEIKSILRKELQELFRLLRVK